MNLLRVGFSMETAGVEARRRVTMVVIVVKRNTLCQVDQNSVQVKRVGKMAHRSYLAANSDPKPGGELAASGRQWEGPRSGSPGRV